MAESVPDVQKGVIDAAEGDRPNLLLRSEGFLGERSIFAESFWKEGEDSADAFFEPKQNR